MDLKNRQRFFLSIFFFLSGFCFSSWASRIPTIKANFNLNDAELGTVLLFMPISSLVGLPISGWLVSRFESRKPLLAGFIAQALAIVSVGFSTNIFLLVTSLCLFSFSMRILGIAMNTQAVTLQKLFNRRINGSFHGLWSTGGIAGVGLSTIMVTLHASMRIHFIIVSALIIIVSLYAHQFLLRNDQATSGNKFTFTKPDPYIVYLGLMIFLASICEGGMFDWSGIFFREVVQEEIFTLGYLIFMVCMAMSRFVSDRIVERIGMPKTFIMSATFIFSGICTAIIFPTFWISIIGFCFVGFGTAAIVPMTFTLASTSKKYSPGLAISIIATYGIAGTFIGPPLIGYISHAFNLRIAFTIFAFAGIMMIPIAQLFFRHEKSLR